MDSLADDLRVAFRRFRHQPGFTAVVLLTLALGLGANTAIFTLVDALMLRSLPVPNPETLFRLGDTNACCVNSGLQGNYSLFPYRLFDHLRTQAPDFVELAGFQANSSPTGVRRAGASAPEFFPGQFVTGNYFQMFRVAPAAGRLLTPDDDSPGAAPVVVLSYRAWERFGRDPAMVGAAVTVNGLAMTVAGIAAREFFGDAIRPDPPAVWIPLGQEAAMRGENSLIERPAQDWLYAIGRLRPNVDPNVASGRATTALQQWLSAQTFMTAQERQRIRDQHIVVTHAGGGVPLMQAQFARSVLLLMVTSAVLLLIAAANLANLLLARADRGQVAIRAALGASGRRLVRQSLTEGVLLALLGGTLGIGVAALGTRALLALAFPGTTFLPVSATPSPTTLMFSLALAIVAGMLFTGAPAWAMARTAPLDALSGVGRGASSRSFVPRRSLVITRVALSSVMLSSAALLAGSLSNLENQPLGFDPDSRLVLRLENSGTTDPTQLALRFATLQERIRRVSGVLNSSYALYSPMEGNNWSSGISIAGRAVDPARPDGASWNRVGPDYFATIGTPVVRGRAIDHRDVAGARRAAVVNRAFATRFFEASDPIGRTVGIGNASHGGDFEIVGVVGDVKYAGANQPVRPMLFLPAFQTVEYEDATSRSVQLRSIASLRVVVVHTAAGAAGVEAALRRAMAEIDPNFSITRVLQMSDQVAGNFRIERLLARLTSIYGVLALVLTALGLYGVTALGVAQRTREIGVRMALGAGRDRIMRTIVGGPVLETVAGLLIGLPLALLAGRAIASQLYGLEGHNPLVFTATIVALVAIAAIAATIPARRAASIDPARALRS